MNFEISELHSIAGIGTYLENQGQNLGILSKLAGKLALALDQAVGTSFKVLLHSLDKFQLLMNL